MVTSVARLAVREEQGVFSQRVSVRAALLMFARATASRICEGEKADPCRTSGGGSVSRRGHNGLLRLVFEAA